MRNVLADKETLSFDSHLDRMKFALTTLSSSQEPAKLICNRENFIVTRQNLRQLDVNQLRNNVLEHIEDFCCSFGKNLNEEDLEESRAINHGGSPEVMAKLAIDFKAAQLFFNLVKQV